MIQSLLVKNFILIDELKLDFDKGLNVFTGETGAGKSIIINAVDIVLGSKVNKDAIKTGTDRAYIELQVCVNDDFDRTLLSENGIDSPLNQLIISREILPSTSRSRINGVLVTQEFIKEIREQLIDIHTQHQNYNYIQPKSHIKLLDNFGSAEHKEIVSKYESLYALYNLKLSELEKVINTVSTAQQQVDFLRFQVNEIENVQIEDTQEDSKLENELEILSNSEKLKELSYSSYWALYGDDNNIVTALGTVKNLLDKLSNMDNSAAGIQEEVINCQEILKDAASRLRDYSERQEPDEERINFIGERLDLLDKIKCKYGNTLENVLKTYDDLSNQLHKVEFSETEIIELQKEIDSLKLQLADLAVKISASRKLMAVNLSNLITSELEKLELPKVRFSVDIQHVELCINGIDKVEFLISTNISEPLKPLAKVASGGEISRVMLAVKTIFAKSDNTNTVIFDEIDTGISGKASQAVADSIANLSETHQILLITHQPIIAAKADSHFYVSKSQEEQTKINVYNLKGENKIKAIALLASGDINDESMNFARGLINA